ncbi:MAG: sulfatase-like hydrolase/transferase [Planctomycetota bacterium]
MFQVLHGTDADDRHPKGDNGMIVPANPPWKALVMLTLLLWLPPSRSCCCGEGERREGDSKVTRPNIIVIFSDDQGYADLGIQEVHDDVVTPHIDGLAHRGVRMTKGFVTAPQCMPSRVGILTGRYQQHSGIETNRSTTEPNRTQAMIPNVETIASYLRQVGYVTGMSGKWGVGGVPSRVEQSQVDPRLSAEDRERLPAARGFDEYFAGVQNLYTVSHRLDGSPVENPPQLIRDSRYRVEVQAEAALGFVDRHASGQQPFFLYYAPYSPHAPFEAPPEYLAKFADIVDKRRQTCLAMMSCVDDSVGRLVDALRRHDIERSTLIWYISDNGAPKNGGGSNAPLNGGKGNLLDGGIRVPFILSWPDVVPAGAIYENMVSALDVLPTCLSAADVGKFPEDLDGTDLIPYLTGIRAGSPHSYLFFRWQFGAGMQAAIRSERWKLLRQGQRDQLFDLRRDPGEVRNVAEEQAATAEQLRNRLDVWLSSLPEVTEAPVPRRRRTRSP